MVQSRQITGKALASCLPSCTAHRCCPLSGLQPCPCSLAIHPGQKFNDVLRTCWHAERSRFDSASTHCWKGKCCTHSGCPCGHSQATASSTGLPDQMPSLVCTHNCTCDWHCPLAVNLRPSVLGSASEWLETKHKLVLQSAGSDPSPQPSQPSPSRFAMVICCSIGVAFLACERIQRMRPLNLGPQQVSSNYRACFIVACT